MQYRKRGKELQRLSAAGAKRTKQPGPQELHSVESGTMAGQDHHPVGGSAVWSHTTEVDGAEKWGSPDFNHGVVELQAHER